MPRCPFCDEHVPPSATSCPHCRGPLPGQPAGAESSAMNDLEEQIRSLLERGQKIEAIKRYREETGVGLAEAKEAVEALQAGRTVSCRGRPLSGPDKPRVADWELDVLRLLQAGKKIQAVKLYRERMGGGLKEAKEAVEAVARRHGIAGRGGCLGILATVVAVVWWLV